MDCWIEFAAVGHSKFPTTKEAAPGRFGSGVELSVEELVEVAGNCDQPLEDIQSDGQLWLSRLLAMETLDAADEALQGWRLANIEWKTRIDVKGTNTADVALNGFRLQTTLAEKSGPFEDGGGSCWKVLTGRGQNAGVEADKIDVGALTSRVCFASAGCESMEKVEGDRSRVVIVRFIPIIWDFGEQGLRERYGASLNICV